MKVPERRKFVFGTPWSSLLLPRTDVGRQGAATAGAAEADEALPPIRWLTVDFKSTDKAQQLDVDVHAFVFTHDGEYIDCIFYKNPVLAGGSIQLREATLYVDLYKVPARAGCIVITLAVYSGGTLVDLQKCATEVKAYISKTQLLDAAEGVLQDAPQRAPPAEPKGGSFPTAADYWAAVLATLEIDTAVTGSSEDAKGMLNCLLAEDAGNWFIKALLQPVPAFTPHALLESAERAAQHFRLGGAESEQQGEGRPLLLQGLLQAALEGKAPVLHRSPGMLLPSRDSQEFEVCNRVSLSDEAEDSGTEGMHERRGAVGSRSPEAAAAEAAGGRARGYYSFGNRRGTSFSSSAAAAAEAEGRGRRGRGKEDYDAAAASAAAGMEEEESAAGQRRRERSTLFPAPWRGVAGAASTGRLSRRAAAAGAATAARAADPEENEAATALFVSRRPRQQQQEPKGGFHREVAEEEEEEFYKEREESFSDGEQEQKIKLEAAEDEGALPYICEEEAEEGAATAAGDEEEEEKEYERQQQELLRDVEETRLLQQQQRDHDASPSYRENVDKRLHALERTVAGLQQLLETVAAAAAEINRKLERRDDQTQDLLPPRMQQRLKKQQQADARRTAATAETLPQQQQDGGVGGEEEEEEEGEEAEGPLLAAAMKRRAAAAERTAAAAMEREDLERKLRVIENVVARGERNQQRVAQSLTELKLQLAGLDQRLRTTRALSPPQHPVSPQLVIDEILVPRQWSRRAWQRREGEYPQAAANSLLEPAAAVSAAAENYLYGSTLRHRSSLLLSRLEVENKGEEDVDDRGPAPAAAPKLAYSTRGSAAAPFSSSSVSPAARHFPSFLRTGSTRKIAAGVPAAGGSIPAGARLTTRRGEQLQQWHRRAEAIFDVMNDAETQGEQLGDMLRCLASYTAADGKKGFDPLEKSIFSFAGDARTFAALHSFENALDRLRDASLTRCQPQ